jgi:CRP-like cAMP-binding protein
MRSPIRSRLSAHRQYFLPSLRLALLRGAQKKPLLTRAVLRLFRKRLRRVNARLENLDSELFRKKKRYLIYRVAVPGS